MKLSKGRYITCKKCNHKFKFNNEKDRSKWISNKRVCPSCKENYCNKPETERTLMNIQDLYFEKDKNIEYMNMLIENLTPYVESLILKTYRQSLVSESLEYYVKMTVSYIIEEYHKPNKKFVDNQFKVLDSFAGYIGCKIKQAVYSKKEHVTVTGISTDWNFEDEKGVEYEDHNYNVLNNIEEEENKLNLLEYVSLFLFNMNQYCEDKYEDYIRLIAIWKNLSLGEKSADQLFRVLKYKTDEFGNFVYDNEGNKKIDDYGTFGRKGKYVYLKSLSSLRTELFELIQNRRD